MTDPRVVEQVMAALDDGVAPRLDALLAVLPCSEAELRSALLAVERYHRRVDAERSERAAAAHEANGTLAAGTVLGDFCIEAVLGSGAMGVVYRARQLSLGRTVALKVLSKHLATRNGFVERFRREAQLASAIRHPYIAEVYGLVDADGTLAFAMRLVEGPTLHEVLQDLARAHVAPVRPTTTDHVRRCVLLARALADALAVIHSHGLVHRDVKPGNVLLEGDGEEPLAGTPVLVDFGLLRPIDESELTNTNTILGTLAYASHESTLGLTVDARADVFSLGATLHDLLTITAPGTRGPATAGLPDMGATNPTIDARLAAVVQMALQPDRSLRYEHGGALRDELDRWLRGDAIRALPANAIGRLGLWVRRDRPRALRVGAMIAILALALAGLLLMGARTWHVSQVAAAAVTCESAGDLVGAAEAFGELRQSRLAWLPWLAGERRRGEDYWADEGVLRPPVAELMRATHAARQGDPIAEIAALEAAGDRMCQALFSQHEAVVRPALHSYLLREADTVTPGHRRRVALDIWANLLIVQEHLPAGGDLPPSLHEVVRRSAFASQPTTGTETRSAAIAALGCLRTCAAFADLVSLLNTAQSFAEAERVRASAENAFRWACRLDPEGVTNLAPEVLTSWGRAVARWHEHGIEIRHVAEDLLAWQAERRARGGVDQLELAQCVQDAMTNHVRAGYAPAGLSAAAARAVHCDWTIWSRPGDAYDLAPPRFVPDTEFPYPASRMVLLPGNGILPPQVRLVGTLLSARCESGQIKSGDTWTQPPYLSLDRPGHSRVRLRSVVPASARRLEVRLDHLPSSRSMLRLQGRVHFRVRVFGLAPGQPPALLPWEYVSVAQNPAMGGEVGTTAVDATVPIGIFGNHEQIEVLWEYMRGDTTHRIRDIELRWHLR
jgi:tRNA A-37 threonylcarbamoyl transferase component Bud32